MIYIFKSNTQKPPHWKSQVKAIVFGPFSLPKLLSMMKCKQKNLPPIFPQATLLLNQLRLYVWPCYTVYVHCDAKFYRIRFYSHKGNYFILQQSRSFCFLLLWLEKNYINIQSSSTRDSSRDATFYLFSCSFHLYLAIRAVSLILKRRWG